MHATVPLGAIGAGAVGDALRAVDPISGPAIAAAVERVLRTGQAEMGVERRGHAHSQPVSRERPGAETVSCVFGATPSDPDPPARACHRGIDAGRGRVDRSHGVVRSWNPGAERLYGYTAAEATAGRSQCRAVRAARALERALRGVAAGAHDLERETVRRRKDGTRVEVWLTVARVRDAGGRVVAISEIGRDVTGRRRDERRTERALRESERRRRQVVASMLHAEEVERSRIATELHDDTVQVMIASLMAMDRVALVAQRPARRSSRRRSRSPGRRSRRPPTGRAG